MRSNDALLCTKWYLYPGNPGLCLLAGGRGRRAQVAVPGDSGADSTAANARHAAGMMARTDETGGGGGVDRGSLPGSATDARMEGALGGIMARHRPDAPSIEPEKCLLVSGIVIRMVGKADDGRGPQVIRDMPNVKSACH